MSRRRFTPRLRLALFLPPPLALLVALPLLWALAWGLIRQSAEDHLGTTLSIVERALEGELGGPAAALNDRVRALASGSEARITVVRGDGLVIADSERSLEQVAQMDDHRERPEIAGAAQSGYGSSSRYSTTLGRDFIYVARPVRLGGDTEYYVRVAEPLAASATLRRRLALSAVLSALAAVIAMTIVSVWLNRKLFRPLAKLVEGANHLAAGRLEARVEIPESEEIAALARALNHLADGVDKQVQNAEGQRERLQLIGDSMADGVLVADPDATVLTINPAFRRLLRVRGQVEGRSVGAVTGAAQIESALRRTLETGTTQTLEIDPSGPQRRTLSVTCSALKDRSGGVLAVRDITEFLLLAEIRRDLVANVSHELRTPLTAIRGYAETLADGALDDQATARRFTERILQQCARLQALLDDLLTLSRLDHGDQSHESRRVDFTRIVEEAAEVLRAVAADREVTLELSLDAVVLMGDPEALAEVSLNLIENAIKYNRRGGRVHIRLSQAAGWAELEIVDTGYGIPDEVRHRIFERFYRVDRGRSRSEGGTGLGLAIVKNAVERHGGTVTVESTLGRTSTFRVRLPLSPASPAGRPG
jgi:two-component system phosphate regulon sensor histidine kinase PhoR